MAKNSLGREIPARWRGRTLDPYLDPWSRKPEVLMRATRPLVRRTPGEQQAAALAARRHRDSAS